MKLNDKEYVLKARQGDGQAYGVLIDSYQGMVFAVALNITGNYADSEDVVQESFIKAYQKLKSLSDPSKFGSWLYTLAKRVAYQFLRERKRVPLTDMETLLSERVSSDIESPAEVYARKELSTILWKEVAELPARTREAILLYYVEDYSVKRAAAFLGITEAAFKMRLKYGREQLRETLTEKLGGEVRSHKPGESLRTSILSALPIGAMPPSMLGSLKLPILVASKAVHIGLIAVVVIAVVTASYLLVTHGGGMGPSSPTTPVAPFATPGNNNNTSSNNIPSSTPSKSADTSQAVKNANATQPQLDIIADATPSPDQTAGGFGTITGWVGDEQGNPVPEAGIYKPLDPETNARSFEDMKSELLARTDAKGRYEIKDIAAGVHVLTAWKQGYASSIVRSEACKTALVSANETISGIDFKLHKPYSISGTVRDHTEAPLEGATVRIQTVRTAAGYQPVMMYRAVTDTQGKYTLENLSDGKYQLAAIMDGYSEESKMDVPAGSENVDFVLAPESGIRGRVTFKDTGEPVPDVTVKARGRATSSGSKEEILAVVILKDGSATTDRDGYYEIKNLNSGQYPVSVSPYEKDGATLVAEPRTVDLPVGKVVENVDFQLGSSSSITGRVYDKETGKPIAGASVRSDRPRDLTATSDDNGNYKISGVTPDRYFLIVTAEGYVIENKPGYNKNGACCATNINAQIDVGPSENLTAVDFPMDPEGVITGLVVDRNGSPVAGARVDALTDRAGLPFNWQWKNQTNEAGVFTIKGLTTGEYYLKTSCPDYVTERTDLIHCDAGKTLTVPDIVLYRNGAVLHGTITDPDDKPIANVDIKVVLVFGAPGMPVKAIAYYHTVGTTRSDSSGEYTVPMLGPGEVEIQVMAQGYEDVTRRLTIEGHDKEYTENFVLGSTGSISGIVVTTKGEPLSGVSILASSDKSPVASVDATSTGPDGKFTLSHVIPGERYTIKFSREGYQEAELMNIAAGAEKLSLTMKKCGTIKGNVVDAVSGAPISDFAVIAYSEKIVNPRDLDLSKIHSADGTFSLGNLQAGFYNLTLMADGYPELELRHIEVKPEEETRLERISLTRTATP